MVDKPDIPSSTRRRALTFLAGAAPVAVVAAGTPAEAHPAPAEVVRAPLTPQDFGAIGDGASHPISVADIDRNPQWIGRYPAGAEWDFVGLQECLYAAYASRSRPGQVAWNIVGALYHLNRPIRIPTGRYRINRPLVATMTGFHIEGEGKLATTLVWVGPPEASMWTCDSAAYGVFAHFGLEAAGALDGALLELDGSGQAGGLKTQQLSLHDMSFVCNGVAAVGLRISKAGGTAQGDTILISNCFFGGAALAGLAVGTTSSQNALGITVHQGDFQGCLPHGILIFGGQVFVEDTSFQNQRYGQTKNQFTTGGADLTSRGGSGCNGFSVMKNIRSESDVLVHAEGGMYLENVGMSGAGIATWSPGLTVAPGYVIRGSPGIGRPGEDGRTFICVSGGVTGVSEPPWRSVARGASAPLGRRGLTVARGSTALRGWLGGASARPPAVGDHIVIPGAGADGGALITTLAAVASAEAATLAAAAVAPVTGAKGYIGRSVTDGGARWIDLDYDAVHGASLTNVSIAAGRTRSCGTYRRCLFTRKDWLRPYEFDQVAPEIEWWRRPLVIEDVQATVGDYNKAQTPHNPFAADGIASTAPERLSVTSYGSGRIGFDTDDDNRVYPVSVGFGRGDGRLEPPTGTDEDISRNIAAVWGTLGRAPGARPNSAGEDMNIQAGLSRGSGAPGKGYLWAGSAAAAGDGINTGRRKVEWGADKVAVHDAAFAVAKTEPPAMAAQIDLSGHARRGNLIPLRPDRDAVLTISRQTVGQELVLAITAVGASPRRITFDRGFRSAGPISTGAVAGKVVVVTFISDGEDYLEKSRTGPL